MQMRCFRIVHCVQHLNSILSFQYPVENRKKNTFKKNIECHIHLFFLFHSIRRKKYYDVCVYNQKRKKNRHFERKSLDVVFVSAVMLFLFLSLNPLHSI